LDKNATQQQKISQTFSFRFLVDETVGVYPLSSIKE